MKQYLSRPDYETAKKEACSLMKNIQYACFGFSLVDTAKANPTTSAGSARRPRAPPGQPFFNKRRSSQIVREIQTVEISFGVHK